jgi:hypothetical protein
VQKRQILSGKGSIKVLRIENKVKNYQQKSGKTANAKTLGGTIRYFDKSRRAIKRLQNEPEGEAEKLKSLAGNVSKTFWRIA